MTDFIKAAISAFDNATLKKIIFSRPIADAPAKISARLCAHRGQKLLSAEYSLPGNTVSQKNLKRDILEAFLSEEIERYGQINLLTSIGDAEMKRGKKGTVVLGLDKLLRKLSGAPLQFTSAIEELEKKKNYMLKGDEPFLVALGISDKNGRVHDKKQGKYRQINRFLEHIEDIYSYLPKDKELTVYDLCCGKSYLSFAVYYYLTEVKKRSVYLLGIDLKKDVIAWCDKTKDTL